MNTKHELTQEGFERYQAELKDLIENQRVANKAELKEAREQGDLSENADYDAARDEQAKIETRIIEIENILRNAKIIKTSDDDLVDSGKRVTVEDMKTKVQRSFLIVGTLEANPLEEKISNVSALGRALMGKEEGDIVNYSSETGLEFSVKIIKVVKVEN